MHAQDKPITERATLFNKLRSLGIDSVVIHYWHENGHPCLLAPLYHSSTGGDMYMISKHFTVDETQLMWSIARGVLPDVDKGFVTINI